MLSLKRHTKKKVIVANTWSTPEARADRLRRLRNMANLSREEICDSEGMNVNTYKGWEIARYGGLPVDGAHKVISRVAREGIICRAEWLLHGVGISPYILPEQHTLQHELLHSMSPKRLDEQKQRIVEEIALFRQQFVGAIAYEIEDDGLAPHYQPEELVAGISRYQQQIQEVVGKDCIVQTETGQLLARHLRSGDVPGKYTLVCSNLQTTVKKPVLYDLTLISAAPIIRHYRINY